MKTTKKTFKFIAALAALVVGFFAAQTYMEKTSLYDKEYSILTPEYEEMESLIINDSMIPLGPEASADEQHPYVQQIADLVNAERTNAGLAPLTLDIQLSSAAQIRAEEQYTLFSHSRPNGSSYRTVLDENGISYMGCGENVAYGFRSPKAVMEGWMNSEGHKANILHEKLTHIGIGYYVGPNGYHYWSQLFTFQEAAPVEVPAA
ncbi:MAG: hypothetical protein E7246_04825 [Lachnoclostridium sp.]|nr:hypothetical protein [Lachnoclostridium sp.]